LPFGPVQAAQLANDPDEKDWWTLKARVALAGGALHRIDGENGSVTYRVGMRRFANLGEVGDFVDELQGAA
jgi:hypothetical protein